MYTKLSLLLVLAIAVAALAGSILWGTLAGGGDILVWGN
jgi:hypothetical protein